MEERKSLPPSGPEREKTGPHKEAMLKLLLDEVEESKRWKRKWNGLPQLLDDLSEGKLREKLYERLGERLSNLDHDSLQKIVKKLISAIEKDYRCSQDEKDFHLSEIQTWVDCANRGLLKDGILEKLRYLPLGFCVSILDSLGLVSYTRKVMREMILQLPDEALRTLYIKILCAKL
ncbi:MAG: hypothetical protein QW098_01125 [Candidatus Hadarchaeales archaeon]